MDQNSNEDSIRGWFITLLLEDYTMTAIVLSIATEPDLDGLQ